MRRDKYQRAMAQYTGHKGDVTVAAVRESIPDGVTAAVTGRVYGMIMTAVNAAYHAGRASCGGAEIIDGDVVWVPVPSMERGGILLPLSVVAQIKRDGARYTL